MNEKDAVRRPQSRFAAGALGEPNGMPLHITMVDDPVPTTNPDAPAEGIDAVLNERGSRYGKFKDHAEITQELKVLIQSRMGCTKWNSLKASQKEALDMICHKIGRIVNGDPDYADSWVDIAGYAKLVADELEGVER